MKLKYAPMETELKIFEINLGSDLKRKLFSMGIHVDDVLLKLNDSNWGPVLIKNLSNGSSKIALDRELADKIIVQYGN